MERNERLKAADKCASRYTDKNVARIARSSFMLGCEFEAQGEAIKGVNLSTLEETEIPNDLEEAADEYEKKHTYQRYDGGGLTPEYDATLAEAFIAGAKWDRSQMLKEAEEGVLIDNVDGTQEICLHGNRYGDKVRIIVIPKEDEK